MKHRLATKFVILLFFFASLASAAASATPSDTINGAAASHVKPSNDNNALQNDYKQYNTSSHFRRNLQAQDFGRIFTSLADTPIDQWTGAQWLCLLIVLVVVSLVLNCLCGNCCRRRGYRGAPYYGQGGYYGGGYPQGSGYGNNRGGGCCSGWSDIFWCLCCFEWCCRDCQDLDACCNAAGAGASGVYQGGEMA